MATYIIVGIIIIYSSWTLYKTIKSKIKGNCNSCSSCSLDGTCPIQPKKPEENQLILTKEKKR